MTTRVKPLPKAAVDTPAPFTLVQAEAVKAIYLGQASEYQQRIGMEWIIKSAAMIGGQSFRSGDSHDTAFGEGKRFVAQQIMGLIEMSADDIRKATNG